MSDFHAAVRLNNDTEHNQSPKPGLLLSDSLQKNLAISLLTDISQRCIIYMCVNALFFFMI